MKLSHASSSAFSLASHDPLFQSMDSQCPPSQSRTRILIACATCRQRKSKCDGVAPICGACHEKGRCCRYEPVSKLDSYKARIRKKHDRQRKNWEKMVNNMAACGLQPPMSMTRVEPRKTPYPQEDGLVGLGIHFDAQPQLQHHFGLNTPLPSPMIQLQEAPYFAQSESSCLTPWQSSGMPPSPASSYGFAPALQVNPVTYGQTMVLETPPLTPSQSFQGPTMSASPSSPFSEAGPCYTTDLDPLYLIPAQMEASAPVSLIYHPASNLIYDTPTGLGYPAAMQREDQSLKLQYIPSY